MDNLLCPTLIRDLCHASILSLNLLFFFTHSLCFPPIAHVYKQPHPYSLGFPCSSYSDFPIPAADFHVSAVSLHVSGVSNQIVFSLAEPVHRLIVRFGSNLRSELM